MKVNHYEEITAVPVDMEGAHGCKVRWLLDEQDGAPNFAMRQFEVEAGGYTPKHHHPYEHEVFILEGEGIVMEDETQRPVKAGDVVFVAPDEIHQFRNTGADPLKFLCLVPNSAATSSPRAPAECSVNAAKRDGE